jgi:hypothetical protein
MLRELRAEDAEAVAAIIRAADSSRGIDADEVRSWLDHAALDPEEVRVLELGGEVVGYVDLLRSEELANVDPSGPGHEGALLDWAETRAREGGAEQTRVHVSEHNVSLADTLRARRYGPAVAAARPRRGAAPARVPRPARAGASPRRARRRRREPDRCEPPLRVGGDARSSPVRGS